ncbi:MAG: 3-phytase [unclassified Hahellaceae]|mgnify:CR=1 FL=1|nr:3-phytase [Hahellaceae bacterium]|tara:strand:- start:62097 stop:64274 length:2178 start_codon:yes stop_codon:yes gene_type:complete
MKFRVTFSLAAILLAGCSDDNKDSKLTNAPTAVDQPAPAAPAAPADPAQPAEPAQPADPTDPTEPGALTTQGATSESYADFSDAAVWVSTQDATANRLVATLEDDGMAIFDASGAEIWRDDSQAVQGADIRYGINDGKGNSIDLLAVGLPDASAIGFFAVGADTVAPVTSLGAMDIGFEPAGLCLHKNVTTDELTVTAFAEDGLTSQYKLSYDGSTIISAVKDDAGAALAVRQFDVGGELSACIVDDERSTLFVAEQEVGVWAYGASPENVKGRQLVAGIEPLGRLQEVEGLDLAYMENGTGYLIVADEGAGFLLYDRINYNYATTLNVAGFDEAKSLAVAPDVLWLANTGRAEPLYERLLTSDLANSLTAAGLPQSRLLSHRELEVPEVQLVRATGETQAVDNDGDAADDPAFWLNTEDPARSLIIATDKQGGLLAYDLEGQQLQYLEEGEPNNVDLRANVTNWDGTTIALAAASNRALNTIALYRIQAAEAGQDPIQPLAAIGPNVHPDAPELQSNLDEVYGLCMYQAVDGTPYVFINGKSGRVEQWRLKLTETGVEGEIVRELSVSSQPEGCVASDADGVLFLGEEDAGIWQFSAEESGSADGIMFAPVDGDRLVADVEGLAIYDNGSTKYLVASSQGNNTYVLYDLLQSGAYAGKFAIIGDDSRGVDGASDSDGIHIVAANLGPLYPEGMLIAQDWYNINSSYEPLNQNFKMVSWRDVVAP